MEDLAVRTLKAKGALEFQRTHGVTRRGDTTLTTESRILNFFDIPRDVGQALLDECCRDQATPHSNLSNGAAPTQSTGSYRGSNVAQEPSDRDRGRSYLNGSAPHVARPERPSETGTTSSSQRDGFWYQGQWQTMTELDEQFQ